MAHIAQTNPIARIFASLSHKIAGFITITSNASRIADDVTKLNALTDAELSALGTTRNKEVERIFSLHSYH